MLEWASNPAYRSLNVRRLRMNTFQKMATEEHLPDEVVRQDGRQATPTKCIVNVDEPNTVKKHMQNIHLKRKGTADDFIQQISG